MIAVTSVALIGLELQLCNLELFWRKHFQLTMPPVEEPSTVIMFILYGVVMAPVMEEMFFRGMLYSILIRKTKLINTALISGMLFALVHCPQTNWLIVPLFFQILGGSLLVYVRHYTGSLLPCILSHSLSNLVVLIYALLTGQTI